MFLQSVNGEILSDTGHITILKVWGTNYERGYAYGYRLTEDIIDMFEGFKHRDTWKVINSC